MKRLNPARIPHARGATAAARREAERALASVVFVIALLTVPACSGKSSLAGLEKDVRRHFSADSPVEDVSCPSDVTWAKGSKFACTLKFVGGDRFTIDVELTRVDGAAFDAHYGVRGAMFPAGTTAGLIDADLRKKGIAASVDCGVARVPKATESCRVVFADGSSKLATVQVDPSGGPRRYDIP